MSFKSYVLVVVGGLLTFGGGFQSFNSIGALTPVLVWGLTSVGGLFVLGFGLKGVLTDSGQTDKRNPDGALGKTDSRFGKR